MIYFALALLLLFLIAGSNILFLVVPTTALLVAFAGLATIVGARRTAWGIGKIALAVLLGGLLLPPIAGGFRQSLGEIDTAMGIPWLFVLLACGLIPFVIWRLGRRVPERDLFAARTHAPPVNPDQEEHNPWHGPTPR